MPLAMSRLKFRLQAEAPGSRARAGSFTALHGTVETPVFMPVGTQASVRALNSRTLEAVGSQVLLANTYHLLLRPGPEVFERFGGINRFMKWDRPVLTDSGGFQIFSLPHSRSMGEDGARFRSYVDGREYLLSPESSIATQRAIGSDIMMVLDQCIPATADLATARTAMELTHRWALRSLAARGDSPQALFGIVQGACHPELRRESARFLADQPFDGLAIGGLAVGESKDQLHEFTALATEFLPRDRPRYLMGVGTPLDILEGVHRGVDMFDCILPVALAHRGTAFTSRGKLQLRRTVYKFDDRALDPACSCETCTGHSRAYLHHLIKADEILGWQLVSIHNLSFYHQLTRSMRQHILAGSFAGFHAEQRTILDREDEEHPAVPGHGRLPRALRHSRLGDYEVLPNPGGWCSIRQVSSGEVMHSVSNPVDEARALYVDQPRLEVLLRQAPDSQAPSSLAGPDSGVPGSSGQSTGPVESAPLVVWDVGLGAATNAMLAINLAGDILARDGTCRPLQLVSFERDLDPLRLAFRNAARFPHLRHAAPGRLLDHGRWVDGRGFISWELLEGDFLATYPGAPVPQVIWYDPFSFKTDAPLWQEAVFAGILAHCRSGTLGSDAATPGTPDQPAEPARAGQPGSPPTRLFTYSASTLIRVRLLCAGWHVAAGQGTGPKAETTVASSQPFDPAGPWQPLGRDWLGRWERSQARYPAGADPAACDRIDTLVRGHPQFA